MVRDVTNYTEFLAVASGYWQSAEDFRSALCEDSKEAEELMKYHPKVFIKNSTPKSGFFIDRPVNIESFVDNPMKLNWEWVSWRDILVVEGNVYGDVISIYKSHLHSGELLLPPVVVRYRDKFIVNDGTHRSVALSEFIRQGGETSNADSLGLYVALSDRAPLGKPSIARLEDLVRL